jgi:dinuclear metal center YbgI/SA1388 family protein
MSLTVSDVCRVLNDLAPEHLAEEWDNVGLLVGDPAGTVTGVLVTLEVTLAVLEEARTQGCQMIVAHHPVIFQPLRAVRLDHPAGAVVHAAIRQGLHLYATHSNLDRAADGTNDVLAERLGLRETRVLENDAAPAGLGRVGTLAEPQPLGTFAEEVRTRLGSRSCRLVGDPARPVQNVAVCGGSGASLIPAAHRAGAEVFVTGDVKYHDALDARARGLALLDAGHYATERPVVSRLAERLQGGLAEPGGL